MLRIYNHILQITDFVHSLIKQVSKYVTQYCVQIHVQVLHNKILYNSCFSCSITHVLIYFPHVNQMYNSVPVLCLVTVAVKVQADRR